MREPRKSSPLRPLVNAIHDDIEFITLTLANHVVDTNAQLRAINEGLQETNAFVQELAVRFARFSADTDKRITQLEANSEERFNQLAGRMRLMDQRFNTFFGASEKGQGELRGKYAELERRVTALEKRLPPTG